MVTETVRFRRHSLIVIRLCSCIQRMRRMASEQGAPRCSTSRTSNSPARLGGSSLWRARARAYGHRARGGPRESARDRTRSAPMEVVPSTRSGVPEPRADVAIALGDLVAVRTPAGIRSAQADLEGHTCGEPAALARPRGARACRDELPRPRLEFVPARGWRESPRHRQHELPAITRNGQRGSRGRRPKARASVMLSLTLALRARSGVRGCYPQSSWSSSLSESLST